MAQAKNYQQMHDDILCACGGTDNVVSVAHCMTRLRVSLKDTSKLQEDAANHIEGVIKLVKQQGEIQFVVGQDVPRLFELFSADGIQTSVVDEKLDDIAAPEERTIQSTLNAVLSFLGGTFSPVTPVIVAGGLTGAFLTLLVNFFGVSADSGTYKLFSYVNQTTFYFLPVFIGYSAANRLKSNGFLGAFLGAILLYYTINLEKGSLDLFGLPIAQVAYNSTVFPVILGCLLLSVVYTWFQRVLPDVLKTIFAPLLTMLVVAPVTLLALAPIGYTLGTGLASVLIGVYRSAPAVAVAFIGCFTPFLVFFGMNNALYPLQFILMAEVGSDPLICAGMTAANLAVSGACIAAALVAKNNNDKGIALGAGISAMCSITEPGVYGVLFTKRFPLKGAMLGGVVGGSIAGLTGMTQYVITACSFIAFPAYIGADGSLVNLWLALLVMALSFALAFVSTYLLGKRSVR